jgi:hypothetical protein
MNNKGAVQSPTANSSRHVPEPPAEEGEWSPAQEDISNKEVKNPDLSEDPEDGEAGDGLNQESGDGTND